MATFFGVAGNLASISDLKQRSQLDWDVIFYKTKVYTKAVDWRFGSWLNAAVNLAIKELSLTFNPFTAEVAFAVVDEFQGQGIGSALLRHLIRLAREAGLRMLIAEVLPENDAMLKVFENSGLNVTTKRDGGTVHVKLQIS